MSDSVNLLLDFQLEAVQGGRNGRNGFFENDFCSRKNFGSLWMLPCDFSFWRPPSSPRTHPLVLQWQHPPLP